MPMYPRDSELDKQEEGRQRPNEGRAPLLVLCAVAALLVLLGFFIHGDFATPRSEVDPGGTEVETETPPTTLDPVTTTEAPTTTAVQSVHPVGRPTWLVIPSIAVEAPIVSVGVLDDGGMETPHSGYVGWYSLGPAPGEMGPAVLISHVDTLRAPDVFYRLKELEPGDEIMVYGSDDDEPAVFVVDAVETQLKTELPKDRIWFYTDTALIRLITCGGEWDSRLKHYLSNVIAYGHLIR